jgi:CheY-like chemotaxis protein
MPPEMDGFEVTAAIREREHSSENHIPIIAMTAHALKGDEERSLQPGWMDISQSQSAPTSCLRPSSP